MTDNLKVRENLRVTETTSLGSDNAGAYFYTLETNRVPSRYTFCIHRTGLTIDPMKLVKNISDLYSGVKISQVHTGIHHTNFITHLTCKIPNFFSRQDPKTLYISISSLVTNEIVFYTEPLELGEVEKLERVVNSIRSDDGLYERDNNQHSIGIILNSGGDLVLQNFPSERIKNSDISISDNYNNDFKNIDQMIKTNIKQKTSENGIIILHSEPGCGKTYYIRHLIKHFEHKKFVFLPTEMSNILSDPQFINFAINELQDSVLVIEEAENHLKSRELTNQTNPAITNILNLADGLFSDILRLKIICTFNTRIDNIDPAIRRKGRLIVEYMMQKLDVEKSNNLLEKLGKKRKTTKPMSLAEIYGNENQNIYETIKPNIGFNQK